MLVPGAIQFIPIVAIKSKIKKEGQQDSVYGGVSTVLVPGAIQFIPIVANKSKTKIRTTR